MTYLLKEKKVLLLDCQTTAMQPQNGHLLEMGWSIFDPSDNTDVSITSHVIQLPDDAILSERIETLTGITAEEVTAGISLENLFHALQTVIKSISPDPIVIVHYAQFEKLFLQDFYYKIQNDPALNFTLLCSHRIAKRLYPSIPSQNLRGMAGFFGEQTGQLKRSATHVKATHSIWKLLIDTLSAETIDDYAALHQWMNAKPKKATKPAYQYRIDKLLRLGLSEKPGIYRMMARDGSILYVGKATSLKSRVNSYFRGQKNRDRRKLEMLAQTWDCNVTECETPLEAALLENDEIKKWNPPYNILLKKGKRHPVFYAHDFLQRATQQSAQYPKGPFKPFDALDNFSRFHAWLQANASPLFFVEEDAINLLAEAMPILCDRLKVSEGFLKQASMRNLLAFALQYLRRFEALHRQEFDNVWPKLKAARKKLQGDELIDAQLVAEKMERLFYRAAGALRRARRLTRLLNAAIVIPATRCHEQRILQFTNGKLNHTITAPTSFPWDATDITDMDRMQILWSEIKKSGCKIWQEEEVTA